MNIFKVVFSGLFFLLTSFLGASEGIRYSCIATWSQVVHVLEVDPALYEIKPIKALDSCLGRESVVSIAERYKAIAAVNGGFFSIGGSLDGRACGALKIDNWYALPFKPRGCIGWSSDKQAPIFDKIMAFIRCDSDKTSFAVHGLNRSRKEGEAILFTSVFNRTTLTYPDGEELIIRNNIIERVVKDCGSSVIPSDGYVLSIQKHHPLYDMLREGSSVVFTTQIDSPREWGNLDYIVGGTPLLIHHCKRISDFESELVVPGFIHNRHARTAVGLLPSGSWIFVVVDKTGLFDGMTLHELADFMESLGCVEALNLDGGGSSTIIYDHLLRNTPHGDEDEALNQKSIRRVSDAIVMIPRY